MEEGYIKFRCSLVMADLVPVSQIAGLNTWRDRLYNLGLIGADAGGIGFGNISIRLEKGEFLISGSATGILDKLGSSHYVVVNEYDLEQNSLTCKGKIKASSESLTHAAIYECSAETNAVIHVHNMALWNYLLDKAPSTDENIPYGTPAMAYEIRRLFNESSLAREKILVMGGHREGIISFGKNLEEAGTILLNSMQRLHG
jgi:L-ribulose-5-phosphate 4-epimerase